MNEMKQQMFLPVYRETLPLETTGIDARKTAQPFNLYFYDRDSFIELIMCLDCILMRTYSCSCLPMARNLSVICRLSFFLALYFSLSFFLRFKKRNEERLRNQGEGKEQQNEKRMRSLERSIVASCVQAILIEREKKKSFLCSSVFFPRAQKKRSRSRRRNEVRCEQGKNEPRKRRC